MCIIIVVNLDANPLPYQMRAVEKRRARVRELVAKQEHLKQELADAKDMLMIDRNTWSYDCEYTSYSEF